MCSALHALLLVPRLPWPDASSAPELIRRTEINWNWSPLINIPLIAAACLYALGLLRLARSGAALRHYRLQIFYFALGMAALAVALDSPLHELGEQLFWAHMVQHEILILICAPLLVLSRPLAIFLWAFQQPLRRRLGALWGFRALGWLGALLVSGSVAWSLHAVALWVWHYPPLFNATLSSDAIHAAQHLSFFGTGLLFWWSLLFAQSSRRNCSGSILYLFTTAIHTSILGALLTFTARPWYSVYANSTAAWNLNPLEDQQLGGLIMWVPAGVLLTGVALALVPQCLRQSDRHSGFSGAELSCAETCTTTLPEAQNRDRRRATSSPSGSKLRAQTDATRGRTAS
jgi:putative membrane protein